jgi:hypothetical protein
MSETIVNWLLGLISNPLLVVGLVLILIAAFLKDEKLTGAPNFKPATLFKKTFNPLPTLAFRSLIGLGIASVFMGILQLSGFLGEVAPLAVSNSKERVIESFPIKVFDYDGVGDSKVKQGWAKLAIAFPDQKPVYHFDYDLPSDGTFGYAGLDFRFDQTQDLSGYRSIKVVLNYFDDTAQSELFIKDISFQGDYVLLGKSTLPGGTLSVVGTEYAYMIPLSNFVKPNFKAIYEIGFSVDTDITKGKHKITVEKISFLR